MSRQSRKLQVCMANATVRDGMRVGTESASLCTRRFVMPRAGVDRANGVALSPMDLQWLVLPLWRRSASSYFLEQYLHLPYERCGLHPFSRFSLPFWISANKASPCPTTVKAIHWYKSPSSTMLEKPGRHHQRVDTALAGNP